MVVTSIPPDHTHKPPYWSDLAEITVATQKKYCALHGYDHHLDVSDAMDFVSSAEPGAVPKLERIRYRVKFDLMAHFMSPDRCGKAYDWVCWLDGDVLMTNYDVPLTKFLGQGKASTGTEDGQLGDLILPYDCNSLHPTVIAARCTTRMRGLMFELTGIGWKLFGTKEWSDNYGLRFAIATPPYRDFVWWHSARELCAQAPGLYPIPADVRAEYEWYEGSLSLHLSALPLSRRIEIAKQYVDKLALL